MAPPLIEHSSQHASLVTPDPCLQTCAQVLLTLDNLANRGQYLNARSTFQSLLAMGAVPIVNENDTVAVEELRFGDNDTLSAQARRCIRSMRCIRSIDGAIGQPWACAWLDPIMFPWLTLGPEGSKGPLLWCLAASKGHEDACKRNRLSHPVQELCLAHHSHNSLLLVAGGYAGRL